MVLCHVSKSTSWQPYSATEYVVAHFLNPEACQGGHEATRWSLVPNMPGMLVWRGSCLSPAERPARRRCRAWTSRRCWT